MSGETPRQRIARHAYSVAWWLGLPLAAAYLLWRSARQPAYRQGWAHRFGLAYPPTADGPLIWIHAVSVGETMAARPIVERLLAACPGHRILLTHMTPTGFETGERLFGGRVERCLLPYDVPFAIGRFLRHYRPTLGILVETELWPNLVAGAEAADVPVALVNARLSERSLRKARRIRALVEPALGRLAVVCAQTEGDAARLAALGRDAVVVGNMKFDLDADATLVERGRTWRPDGRPVVLAASTRDGEEAAILDAWPDTDALLAIVPRHPQRFDEVHRTMARRFGARLARRSTGGTDGPGASSDGCDALLGDSMGEMYAYYAMADVAILGGSLAPFGGQNLIEACAVGVPVVIGPHTYNFADAAERAIDAGAAIRVGDAKAAIAAALAIAGDPARRDRMRESALSFAAAHRGATARTVARLAPLLGRVDR
jgi:3-deoxy-D-manno-octulosonic-acid transferase